MSDIVEIKECISQEEKHEVWKILDLVYDEITIPNYEEYKEKVCQHAQILKAVYNGIIVGFVAFYANNIETKQAYITQIIVLKEYQNKHIGHMLLTKCFDYSRDVGMKECKLEVYNDNLNAIAFYKKNGFCFKENASEKSKYFLAIL